MQQASHTLTAIPANISQSLEKQGSLVTVGMFPPDPWTPEPTSSLDMWATMLEPWHQAQCMQGQVTPQPACVSSAYHCPYRLPCSMSQSKGIGLQRSSPGLPAFPPMLELTRGAMEVVSNSAGCSVPVWFGSPRTKAYSPISSPFSHCGQLL